jgi:hypothetical protein
MLEPHRAYEVVGVTVTVVVAAKNDKQSEMAWTGCEVPPREPARSDIQLSASPL